MASFLRTASLVLSLSTVLLISGCCNGRPHPPDFTSYFVSPTSIRVEWQTPTLDAGATVKGFRLQYKLGERGKVFKLKTNGVYTYDIEGLDEACGDYRIRMSTASSSGLSRYTSYSQVERVNSAPQNLNAVPSDSSARVTWDPPENGFCITGYELKYGPDNSQDENELRTMQLPIELNQYLLSDLEPATSYMMSLTALAGEEMSEEAFFQWYQAPVAVRVPVPGTPINLRVDPSSTGTVDVTWSSPSSEVTRYEYLYGTSDTPDIKMTSGYVQAGTTRLYLEGLRPGEEYVIKVTSVNSVGQSSAAVVTWRQPAPEPVAPPSKPLLPAPGEVTVRITSAETVLVTWTPPEGDIEFTGYIVGFGLQGTANRDLSLFSIPPDELEIELDELKPGSEYMVNIQAYDDVGDGAITSAEWLQEAPEVPLSKLDHTTGLPTEVRQVLTYSSSPATVMVSWVSSEEEAAEQTAGFRVTYGQTPAADEFSVDVDAGASSVELQELKPDTFYYLKVYKFNAAGVSRPVSRSLQTLAPPPEIIPAPTNLQASVLNPTSARISWTDESLGASQTITDDRSYNVRYHPRHEATPRYIEEQAWETSFVADSLIPGVQYEFHVQLILGPTRRSELSAPVFVTSRDPAQGTRVQRFTVTQVSVANPRNAKAVLNWLPPPDAQNVMEYRIEYTDAEKYRDPATIWQREIVDGSKLSTTIEGLRPDTEYHIMITAVFSPTEAGPALAAPVSFTTPVIPPSSKARKRCGETELQAVTRRVNFLWDDVANGEQRPPLYGVPIPYCDDEFGVEECHGIFCFCIPGKRPAALRNAECTADEPPCRREYNAARMALDEARQSGIPATAALLPHCREDGYYHPKQCSGTMCYCVTENGAHTGLERPMWESSRLNCA